MDIKLLQPKNVQISEKLIEQSNSAGVKDITAVFLAEIQKL